MSEHQIKISDEDGAMLLLFSQYREKFKALLDSGALGIKSGKVEININNGVFQNIHIYQMTYRRNSV